MIKDLGLFAWRVGLVLIIATPLLYIVGIVGPMAFGDGGHPVAQVLLSATMIVPPIFLSIAVGCALCLLVRIEMHLRKSQLGEE